jgi:hypothetical protein
MSSDTSGGGYGFTVIEGYPPFVRRSYHFIAEPHDKHQSVSVDRRDTHHSTLDHPLEMT